MTKIEKALEMAQKLNVTILSDDGAYKFRPMIRPGRDETVYIHNNTTAIQDSKTGLEWRFSSVYRKAYYQVIDSRISIHIFTTLPALCGWLENETIEQEARKAQEKAEIAAQSRADKEGVTVYAIRAGQMFFVCTYEEIARDHAEDSIQVIHTATPTHKPTGEEIADSGVPGDTDEEAEPTILDETDIFGTDDIYPDEKPPITSEDDPFSFTDEEIQEATKDLPAKINKNQLKRGACALMANWLQSCLEAGNTATYQDQNGLTDEETQFLTDYIKQEIGKLDLRGTPPSERNSPPDDNDDFPLYLEYQNLY